jgi:hypothetical protein
MTPFEIIDSINNTKKPLIVDDVSEKAYDAFMVNKGLSYFQDTVIFAQQMNINYHIDSKLQYDYLFNSIRKKKRYSKWFKKEKDADIDAIKIYFNYGYRKAQEALTLLSKEQVEYIKEKVKGGACQR